MPEYLATLVCISFVFVNPPLDVTQAIVQGQGHACGWLLVMAESD